MHSKRRRLATRGGSEISRWNPNAFANQLKEALRMVTNLVTAEPTNHKYITKRILLITITALSRREHGFESR